jgi:hypothetical protein
MIEACMAPLLYIYIYIYGNASSWIKSIHLLSMMVIDFRPFYPIWINGQMNATFNWPFVSIDFQWPVLVSERTRRSSTNQERHD